jgi:hypothetical protein
MTRILDARVPVGFGALAEGSPEVALLIEGAATPAPPGVAVARFEAGEGKVEGVAPHAAGCACCVPRHPVADALRRLFQARARGEVPFFRRVVAVCTTDRGTELVDVALALDPTARAWFRRE